MRADILTVADRFAALASSKVWENGLFGKPYIKLGPLYTVAGWWLFQTGGAMGYGLSRHSLILGKLLGATDEKADDYVHDVLKGLASEKLERVEGKESTFLQLYLVPTLSEYGINPFDLSQRWAKQKIDDKSSIFTTMQIIFQRGVALGYHFPDEFRSVWEETYKREPQVEWTEMYELGIVSSANQELLDLCNEARNALSAAADWVRERAPDQITPQELATLEGLAQMG